MIRSVWALLFVGMTVFGFGQSPKEFATAYFDSANVSMDQGQYQQVIDYALRSVEISKRHGYWKEYLMAANLVAEGYFKLSENEKGLAFLTPLLEEVSPHLPEVDKDIGILYNNLGTNYIELGQYEKGIIYYQKAISIWEQLPEKPLLEISAGNHNLGSIEIMLGNYEDALPFLFRALNIRLAMSDPDQPTLKLDESYNNIGYCYASMEQPEKALPYFLKSLEVRSKSFPSTHPKIGLTYNNLAMISAQMKDYQQAATYYEQALPILTAGLGATHPLISVVKSNYGGNHLAQGNDTLGLAYLHWVFEPNEELKPNQILFENPDLPEFLALVRKSSRYLHLLSTKAAHYADFGKKVHSQQALAYSLESFQLLTQAIDTIRIGFSDTEKQILSENSLEIYEEGIEVAYELYQQTQDRAYMELAFSMAEKSKAVSLLEEFQEENAKLFANIPETLQSQERSLKQSLASAKEKLYEQRQTGGSSSPEIIALQEEIFSLKSSYDSLLTMLEKSYPAYFDLKYDVSSIGIEELQAQIPANTQLIEYFTGDSSAFIFLISAEEASFHKLTSVPILTQKVLAFRDEINLSNPAVLIAQESPEMVQQRFARFQQMSTELYELLLGKWNPTTDKGNLLIVPDGVLNFISFGALGTTDQDALVQDFRDFPYLLKQYGVSYAYSSTLAFDPPASPPANYQKGYGGFAPRYSSQDMTDSRGNFQDIPLARKEVRQSAEIFDGDAFLGDSATKSLFLTSATNYQILHLAMHTAFEDASGFESRLVFGKEEEESDQMLRSIDLYQLRLPADLVVLSACNSGWGEVVKGEGVMSLARAFAYAGSRSQILSLWKVDDYASSQLILNFYEQVQNGQSLDEAMRKGQLRFIETAPNSSLAHPYYWATFLTIGDTAPIDFPGISPLLWFLFVVFAGLAVLWIWRRRG